MFQQKYRHAGWWPQLCSEVGLFQGHLEPCVACMGQSQPLRGHHCSPTAAFALPCEPHAPFKKMVYWNALCDIKHSSWYDSLLYVAQMSPKRF